MNSHIKDLSGKIAKPAFVEKVIERKKDKRKLNEGERKIVVIARNGNKFTKKDIFYAKKKVELNETN
jgi:ribosomal protein L30E